MGSIAHRRSDDKLYHHDKFDGSVSNGQSYSQWREKKRSVVTRSNRSQTQAVQYQNPGAMVTNIYLLLTVSLRIRSFVVRIK